MFLLAGKHSKLLPSLSVASFITFPCVCACVNLN